MPENPSIEAKVNILHLAQAVLEESRNGGIEWQESEDSDSFFTILAGRALTVRSDDADASHPFTLWVAEKGQILESVNTVGEPPELKRALPDWHVLVADLYAEGRKKGTRVNQVVDEMFRELKQKQREKDLPF